MRKNSISRRSIAVVSLLALVSQIVLSPLAYAADPTMSTTLVQANVPAEAQVVQLSLPKDIQSGDTVVFTMSWTTVTQSFDTSSQVTLGILNVKIDALPTVSSVLDQTTRTFTVTSSAPWTWFPMPTLDIQSSPTTSTTIVNNVVAVAQEAEFAIQASLIPGDTVYVTVAWTWMVQSFSIDKATTLTQLAASITSNTAVAASYSGSTGKVHLIAKTPGNAFSISNIMTVSNGVSPHLDQANVVPVAQVSSITLPRTIEVGETLSVNVAGSLVSQSYSGSTFATMTELMNQIDALPSVHASLSGSDTLVVTSAIPGTPFILSSMNVTWGVAGHIQTAPNIPAVAQVDTIGFSRNFVPWDSLSGSVNGTVVHASYSGSSDGTLLAFASAIDALSEVDAVANTGLRTITITASAIGVPFTLWTVALETNVPSASIAANIVAKAQKESFSFPRDLVNWDEIEVVLNGNTVTKTFSGTSDATFASLASSLTSGGITATFVPLTRSMTVEANTAWNTFSLSQARIANQGGLTIIKNPVTPIKQVVTYSIPNTLIIGDAITGTIGWQTINVSFDTDEATTFWNLVTAISGVTGIDAQYDSGTRALSVQAESAGVGFAATDLTITGAAVSANPITSNAIETRASVTLDLNTVPLESESILVWSCTVSFVTGGNDYDCSGDDMAQVARDSGSTTLLAALMRGISGISDPVNGTLIPSGSGNRIIYTRSGIQVGNTAIQFTDSTTPGSISSSIASPQAPAARSDSFTLPRALTNGDIVRVNIDGVDFSQSYLVDSATTIANLSTNIGNLPQINTGVVGQTITLTAANAGTDYTLGTLSIVHTSQFNQSIANVSGQQANQNISFASGFVPGDTVTITVNGTQTTTPFATDSTTTLLNIATALSGISGIQATASGSDSIDIVATNTGTNLVISQAKIDNSISASTVQVNVSAQAQSDSYVLGYDLQPAMTIIATINGAEVSQPFTTDTETTMTLLSGKIGSDTVAHASYSGAIKTLTLLAKSAGSAYTSSLVIRGESISPVNVTPNTSSGAQVEKYSFTRPLVSGETLSVTIDGAPLSQAFTVDTNSTLVALANSIDGLASVDSIVSGQDIIVTAHEAGIWFSTGALTIDLSIPVAPVTANVPAQAQISSITLPRSLVAGDTLSVQIDSTPASVAFSGSESATLSALAAVIGSFSWVDASASGSILTVQAEVAGIGFSIGNLDLSNSISGTTVINNVSPVAQVDEISLPTFYSGDTASITVDGTPISVSYTSDSMTMVNSIVSAVDAVSSVHASLSGSSLIVTASTPGTPFTLSAFSLQNHQNASTIAFNVPAVAQSVSITANDVITGWTFRVTVNGTPYDYLSNATDTDASVATSLASIVTSTGVTATASGAELLLNANVPGTAFTYSAIALDITAPSITDVVSATEALRSGATSATSISINENGAIYFVLSGSVVNSISDLNALIVTGEAFLGQSNATAGTPYTFVIPSGVTDGVYGVIAIDTHGNISSYHSTGITLDSTAPIIVLNTTSQTVATPTIDINGSTEANLAIVFSNGSFSGNTVSLWDGTFSGSVSLATNTGNLITVTATDAAGNQGFANLNIVHDDITPSLSFSPSATITSSTNLPFTGTTEPFATVYLTGGAIGVSVIALTDGSFSGNVTLQPNAVNILGITTTDAAGNSNSGSVSVTHDSIAPTVTLSTASGSIVNSDAFVISGTTEMNASIAISTSTWLVLGTGTATSTGAYDLSATLPQNVTTEFNIVATDAAGNTGTGYITVTEDSIPNSLLIQSLPAATNASNLMIQGSTKPNSLLTLSGGLSTMTGSSASDGTFAITAGLNLNATNTFLIQSVDQVGNVSTGSVNVIHDSVAPTISVSPIHSPTSSSNLTLSGTTEPLASVTISGWSGSSVWTTANASGSYSVIVPLNLWATNNLSIVATDAAGNSGSTSLAIVQDPIPLTLNVLAPSASVSSQSITLTGSTKSGATISVTGSGNASSTADSLGAFSVTIPLIADAPNHLILTASDTTGAQLTQTFDIIQDSTAPTLALATLTGATKNTSFLITGTTEPFATVQILPIGVAAFSGAILATADGSGAFQSSIPLVANSTGSFSAIAFDSVNNQSPVRNLTLLQDSVAPTVNGQSFSGSSGALAVGYYAFTTDEVSTSTFYVWTGSNILATLIWSGSTTGIAHAGSIPGIQPNYTYTVFIRSVDTVGNISDTTATGALFTQVSSGNQFSSSGGGGGGGWASSGGGGSGGGYITVSTGAPSTPVPAVSPTPTTTASGSTTMKQPTTQSGSSQSIRTPSLPVKNKALTTSKPTTQKEPVTSKPTVDTKPNSSTTKPASSVPTTGSSKWTVVQGPGFEYAITNKNMKPNADLVPKKKPEFVYEPKVQYISAANSVKVRSTPTSNSELVDILVRNSRVMLVDELGSWGKIEFGSSSWWVALEYLRSIQDSDLARTDARLFEAGYTPAYPVTFHRITAYSLNLRSGPGTWFRAIWQLLNGEQVVILDSVGFGWIEVRTKKGIGYIQKSWVE